MAYPTENILNPSIARVLLCLGNFGFLSIFGFTRHELRSDNSGLRVWAASSMPGRTFTEVTKLDAFPVKSNTPGARVHYPFAGKGFVFCRPSRLHGYVHTLIRGTGVPCWERR